MDVSRRQFIQSTLTLAASMGVLGIAPLVRAGLTDTPVLTLYDPRFHPAREAAEALARGCSLSTVGSDITDVAHVLLEDAAQGRPAIIFGVTTETVPFCLQQLGSTCGRTTLDCKRMDQDLFIWKLTVVCT
jgi:hypothetical protein